ncbi:hypothetical protein WJX74_001828 [Apatococcus lobatus]|uniref:RanBD1 domain-containing protein n=2 Tax=Apatococcus TaxID=904362 RepID=A0AAW1SMK4_9CHLO
MAGDKEEAATATTSSTSAAGSNPAEETKATPVFGSASTFSSGTGFAGFTSTAEARNGGTTASGADEENADEEECQAEFQPLVQLQEVETTTGEEAETTLVDFKCKLYRFDNDSGEWKERGVGRVRLLEHKENKRIRLLMRQEKTLKIRANHIIMPGTKLQEHSGNDKSWVWSTVDFAEEEQKPELFCIRFASVERAAEFKKEYEKAVLHNEKMLGLLGDDGDLPADITKADDEADELAEGVSKVGVSDEKPEGDKKAADGA